MANPEDFYVQFDPIHYEGALVDAPLPLKIYKVNSYLGEVLKSCRRCLTVDAEIPAVITTLAAVDYLAGFFSGQESTGADYKAFMAAYFPPAYAPFLDRIYVDLRCGLVHNLVAINPWRSSAGSFLLVTDVPNHLAVEGDRVVWSIRTFIEHTYVAWLTYLKHVMSAPPDPAAVACFHKRFDKLAGTGALMEKV